MKRSRFTETQIISILNEADAGMQVKEICWKYVISDAIFYIYGVLPVCKYVNAQESVAHIYPAST